MSNEFPPMIGKYKVQGIIAKGGMGVVYKAVHPSLKRFDMQVTQDVLKRKPSCCLIYRALI